MLLPPVRQALAGVRQRPLHHLNGRDSPGAACRREDAAPRDDAALLLSWVEQHERGVGDTDDRGQGRSVRVVDHDGVGLGVDPLTQPSRIARQRQRAGGARVHDATAVQQLPAGGSPEPPRADWRPLDELAPADADERQRDEEQDDREGHHHGADVQADDQGARREAGHQELRPGEAEQYAALASGART